MSERTEKFTFCSFGQLVSTYAHTHKHIVSICLHSIHLHTVMRSIYSAGLILEPVVMAPLYR